MTSQGGGGPRRIGVFGGTFDPVHIAHLRCAEEAREALALDEVVFVPAGAPPHRRRPVAPARSRLEMVRLAVRGNPHFRVSDVEAVRPGPSYTVETLRTLSRSGREMVLLVGADQYREIATWHEWEELFRLADVAVLTRAGVRLGRLRAALPVEARRRFWYEGDTALRHESGRRVILVNVSGLEVSASDIRARLRAGRSVRYLVPDSVLRYACAHGLYA